MHTLCDALARNDQPAKQQACQDLLRTVLVHMSAVILESAPQLEDLFEGLVGVSQKGACAYVCCMYVCGLHHIAVREAGPFKSCTT